MTHQKTCLYCLNCNYLSGSAGGLYEPPEPDTWECELVNNNTDPAYFDQFSELEETIASTCQYFQPRMAKSVGIVARQLVFLSIGMSFGHMQLIQAKGSLFAVKSAGMLLRRRLSAKKKGFWRMKRES